MKGFGIALAAIAVLVLVIGGFFFTTYNGLVSQDESIKQAWKEVENQMQRRFDLIPNLVNTVKGYATHEKAVFDDIAAARAKMAGAQTPEDKMAASNNLGAALGRLLLVVENYPNLKANETFIQLMDELAGTENRLAVARGRYNQLVQTFNAKIRRVPTNMIANMFGFKAATYFEVQEEAKQAPKVNF